MKHYKKVHEDKNYKPNDTNPIDENMRLNVRQIEFWKRRRWNEIDEIKKK